MKQTFPITVQIVLVQVRLCKVLADGYFVIPYTIGNYLGGDKPTLVNTDHEEFDKVQKEIEEVTK